MIVTTMKDHNIFESEEKFVDFVFNYSTEQYLRLLRLVGKIKGKEDILLKIKEKFGFKFPKNASYQKIVSDLQKNSVNFWSDILERGPIEIAHLCSFYKMLTDVFWEAPWQKRFSPIYTKLFGKPPKIRNKSDLRRCAAEIVTSFSEDKILESWVQMEHYPPVVHYRHFTIGPLGLKFSIYFKEKAQSEYSLLYNILLGNRSDSEESIVDWKRTDVLRLFLELINAIERKLKNLPTVYGLYLWQFLRLEDLLFSELESLKNNLREFSKEYKERIQKDEVPIWFYAIVQLSEMLFTDDEIVDILNKLIADEILHINIEPEYEERLGYFGPIVTKYAIITPPEPWFAEPSYSLAEDISKIAVEDFETVLFDILENGAARYLEKLYNEDIQTFKELLCKNKIYKIGLAEKPHIPKKYAIKLLLECYGIYRPLEDVNLRNLRKFLYKVQDFKSKHRELDESQLITDLKDLLIEGRDNLERLIKEFVFILITLVKRYNDIKAGSISSFPSTPFPHFSKYRAPYDAVATNYKELIEQLPVGNQIRDKVRKAKDSRKKLPLTLGDWYQVFKAILKKIENISDFWDHLPSIIRAEVISTSKMLEKYLEKSRALFWLNKAHHPDFENLMYDIDNRREALDILLVIDEFLLALHDHKPPLIKVTKEVKEVETGLRCYEANYESVDGSIVRVKIYGTRDIETTYTYYLIPLINPRKSNGDVIFMYPLLITNLVDIVF